MELICIGDLHLTDSNGVGGLAKYLQDPDAQVIREVTKVFKYAKQKDVKHIVFLGDVCENPRMSYEAMHALFTFLRSKLARRFEIHIIVGNHDKLTSDSDDGHSLELLPLMDLEHVHLYTNTTEVEIEGAAVNFMPWPDKKFKKKFVNIAHIEVHGSQLDSGRLLDNDELSMSEALGLIGHLHTPHRVRNMFYSGTLYQTNFGEKLEKFFIHLEFNSLRDYEVHMVPHSPDYRLHNVIISAPSDLKQIIDNPHDLYKVIVEDGADIGDYQFGANVVINKAFKTKQELVNILSEDLMHGQELELKSNDLFQQWLSAKKLDKSMHKRVRKLRERLLKGND